MQIAIAFDYNHDIRSKIKEIASLKWSSQQRNCYLEHSTDNVKLLKLQHTAEVDATKLVSDPQNRLTKAHRKPILDTNQKTLLTAFYKYLKGRRYSKSTITTYTN